MKALPRKIQAVELEDDMTAEFMAGMKFAAAFYASGRKTLISQIPSAELENWDGESELALVTDLDGSDLPDDAACEAA